ncbi:unnamed protein product [Urochloa decumbens]|uniref:Reverse transcriptase zinc-binding domain-containing protein n=1 Tax=Urochloa decumbens TaxID=240449 RepID=A0ABC9F0A1_9POAL
MFWKGTAKCTGGDCQVAWQLACRGLEDGGVGLKDLATLNTSLLLKHIHKLFTGVNNPWTDWIRLWYDDGYATEDTPCWRSLKALIPQYRRLTSVAPGNGRTTSFWHDAWTEAGRLAEVLPALYSHCLDTGSTVAEVPLTSSHVSPPRRGMNSPCLVMLQWWASCSLTSRTNEGWPPIPRKLAAPAHSTKPSGLRLVGLLCPRSIGSASLPKRSIGPNAHAGSASPPWHPGLTSLPVLCRRRRGHRSPLRGLPTLDTFLGVRSPPASAREAAESVAGLLVHHGAALGHTAALGVLWVVWKSRNRKVFDDVTLSANAMRSLLEDHLKLWVCRASRKLVTTPLLDWCHSVTHVT